MTHALYERHARQIYNYCLHQLSSREEAEDAVQTTFMNAFRGLKRGIVPEAEQAWLFKIAENVCLSRRRSSWRRGRVESPNDFEVLQEIVPSRGSRADELIGLEDALEAMPENQRRAILLREWQGLSYREIAGELAISQAAVETLIFRARRTLAQGLEDSPAAKRRAFGRTANGLSAGSLLTALKSALTGGAAVKAVAVAVAAGTATVAATDAPKRVHVRQPHAAALGSLSQTARPTSKGAIGNAGRSHARTARYNHAKSTAGSDRVRKRVVTAAVVVARAKTTAHSADEPAAGPTTPLPPSAPADQPAATPPTTDQPGAADDHKVGTASDHASGNGNAYGHDKKATEPTAAEKANGKDNDNNGKQKDAPPPPAPAASQPAPPAPAPAPATSPPPTAPADAAPAPDDDHGNGHADDAHGAGKDKAK